MLLEAWPGCCGVHPRVGEGSPPARRLEVTLSEVPGSPAGVTWESTGRGQSRRGWCVCACVHPRGSPGQREHHAEPSLTAPLSWPGGHSGRPWSGNEARETGGQERKAPPGEGAADWEGAGGGRGQAEGAAVSCGPAGQAGPEDGHGVSDPTRGRWCPSLNQCAAEGPSFIRRWDPASRCLTSPAVKCC